MEQEDTAFHEAGHIVVARHLGLAVRGASIVAENEAVGRVHVVGWWGYESTERRTRGSLIQADIMAVWAGPAAEKRFNPDADGSWWKSDEAEAWDMFSEYPLRKGADENVFMRRLQRDADRLVELLWPDIEMVAAVLFERQTLTAAQIENILERWDVMLDENDEELPT